METHPSVLWPLLSLEVPSESSSAWKHVGQAFNCSFTSLVFFASDGVKGSAKMR